MAGTSSINLAGSCTIATARKSSDIALSQIVGDIEAKQSELLIPLGGALTTVPLNLSSGVTEALMLVLYAPKKLIIEITSTDTDNSQATEGPVRLGLKGLWFMTLAPEEGIIVLKAKNPSSTENVTLEYVVGAIQKTGDEPSHWE